MRNIIDRGNWSEWGRQGNIYFPSLLSSLLSCIQPPHQERQSRAKREKVKSKKAENNGVWLSSNSLHNCCEIIFNFSFLGLERHIMCSLVFWSVWKWNGRREVFCVVSTYTPLFFSTSLHQPQAVTHRNHPGITVALLRSRFQ